MANYDYYRWNRKHKDDFTRAKSHHYGLARHNAYRKDLEFTITFEEFCLLTSLNCYYCDSEPKLYIVNKSSRRDPERYYKTIMNGIDRVNNNVGYIVENCKPCCFVCNRAKAQMTELEFLSWIKKVHDFRGLQCETELLSA